MFSSNRHQRYQSESFSKHRAGKSKSKKNPSFRDSLSTRKVEKLAQHAQASSSPQSNQTSPSLGSTVITLAIGREQRLFAAHEDILTHSPFFASAIRDTFFQTSAQKRIDLPDEEPEVFSSVLEYLYKGDYYPKLDYDKRRNTWFLEDGGNGNGTGEAVIYTPGGNVLKDTVIYCAAEKYSLPELKRLALRKQGLQSGIQCSTILTSARYAYANTPDNDSKLRAHYLALIIRARHTFKRSGTMQNEMENGGKLFFDLFVALVNHMDDVGPGTPR